MVLISVIVPVYNVEQYIHCCLESILNQNFKNFEVILINDGSTDLSGNICDEYKRKDSRVRVFHKQNGGLSSARNVGIDHAHGEYIIFVDSDDYWVGDDVLQHLYDVAQKNDADVVRGEYTSIDENANKIKTITKDKKGIELKILDSATFYIQAINGENFSWLFLFKKNSIGNLRFNEERKFQEDIEFNICYNSIPHRCVYTSKNFYAYRKRQQSITTSINKSNLEGSFSLCHTFREYSDITEDLTLKQVYFDNAVMMYYWTLDSMSQDPYYKERFNLIADLELTELNKCVRRWAEFSKKTYPLPIYISPVLGIYYFRFKHHVGRLLRTIKIRRKHA